MAHRRRDRRKRPDHWPEVWQPDQSFASADATGTVATTDGDCVREFLEAIAMRLKEVGIQFVSFGYLRVNNDDEIQWYVHAADPVSTHDELACMVVNALREAGVQGIE